jgi:plasmid stabilization system protein ParE
MALIRLPEAQADIQRLFDFLMEINPAAAGKAIRTIRAGAARLRQHPRLGRPMADGLRR